MDKPCSPDLDWTDGLPCSRQFDDVYFSRHNGLEETRHVFLHNNQLKQRFNQLKPYENFTIAETGFGTGLNFLATWKLWQENAPKTGKMHFISVEKYPLSTSQLARALTLWPELKSLSQNLIERYPNPVEQPVNRLLFDKGRVQLTLLIGDVQDAFEALDPSLGNAHLDTRTGYSEQKVGVDAWFLDGFSPSKNPEMWQPKLYHTMAKLSSYAHSKSTIATFTAAGHVRRGLEAAGFSVSKVPGFGRKREMVAGALSFCTLGYDQALGYDQILGYEHALSHNRTLDTDNSSHPDAALNQQTADQNPELNQGKVLAEQPSSNRGRRKQVKHYWHTQLCKRQRSIPSATKSPIAVIGAGLAGCHTAHALALRGYSVHLFDAGEGIATGASGNPQGIVYSRFSHQQDALAEFNLTALRYADAFYSEGFYDQAGSRTGVLHLSQTEKLSHNHAKIAAHYQNETAFKTASLLTNQEASQRLKQTVDKGGLMSELGGWLRPKVLCEKLAENENIQVLTHHHLTDYQHDDISGWKLAFKGKAPRSYSRVVIANAFAAKQLPLFAELPTKAIRGQVTTVTLPANQPCSLRSLSAPICGEGYIAPPYSNHDGMQCTFGATFDLKSTDPQARIEDNHKNRDMAQALLSEQASAIFGEESDEELREDQWVGRASFRCATSDYLPIVGPACTPENRVRFKGYTTNRFAQINQPGAVYDGLYLNVGHGSRGLTYTPIAAELIASLISGETLPLSEQLYQGLHPGRFTIRSLMRNRPLS